MAMDLKGLFANPADIRQKRLEGLQQQRRQIGQMGGSMSGLLGQVAAGGSLLGEQLAEGIAGGLGLKTQQEAQAEAQQQAIQGMNLGSLTSMKAARDRLSALDNVNPAALAALDDRIMQAEDRALQRQANNEARQRAIAAEQRAAATFRMQEQQFNKAAGDEAAQREAIAGMLPGIDDAYMSPEMKSVVMTLPPAQALTFVQSANKQARQAVKLAAFNTTANSVLDQLNTSGDPAQRPSVSQINQTYFALIEQARNADLESKAESLEAQRKALTENVGDIKKQEESLRSEWTKNTRRTAQRTAVEKANSALNLLDSATAAGDIASIFEFMKALDPNSVVREGEFAMAQQIGGLASQLEAKYGQLEAGERLTPNMRREIAETLQVIATSTVDAYNAKYDEEYEDYSGRQYDANYILGSKLAVPNIEGMTFGATVDEQSDTQLTDAEAGVGF